MDKLIAESSLAMPHMIQQKLAQMQGGFRGPTESAAHSLFI